MRILIINPILYTAETDSIPKVESIKDTMIYTMCKGFQKVGHEPVLIAASDFRPEREEEYPFEIVWMDTVYKRICKPRCLPFMPKLGSYIKKNKNRIDGIITSEVFSLHSFTAARQMKNKTIIWHELGAHNKIFHYVPSRLWYNIIARFFLGNVRIIARSEYAGKFIRRYCRNVSETIIEHGVDIRRIKAKQQKKNHFVVVSQLIPRKRIEKIINIFAAFVKQSSETQMYILDIAGRGEQEQQLKEQAAALLIADKVIFHGHMTHEALAPVIADAKAMLVYTKKDNSMVSIAESIAAGTPVITTTVPFNASYIKREKLGIVQDDWDVDALNKICGKNEEYVRSCIKYRDKLSAEYCCERFIKELQQLI